MMMRRMHFVVSHHHHQRSVKSVVYALLLSFSLSSNNSNNVAVIRSTATMTTQAQPPVAKKVPHQMELFGDVRVDNYYWLRDDSRSNPDMLSYLQQENAFTDSLIVKIQDIQLFNDHLVVYERENGLPKVTIYGLPDVGEPLKSLQGGHLVEFIDPIYSVDPSESQFNSSILRFYYSSMKTPPSVYDYDMKTGVSVLKKIETVLGGFDASNYFIERKWANAPDGTQIPISIVYRKDLVKLDGSDPLLLYGYGSYEACIDPNFKASRLSLLDRGFIYEWGDPRKEEFYFYMKSYSPVDNVKAQNYPDILVTAGLNDPRVMYSEPAKFVAKLRDLKTDDNLLLFKCELGAGHFSKSGRFEKLQEDAFTYAFIMKSLNMIPGHGSEQN
ncbi:hypothetical protein SO802_019884 [Lithocarpus litseifolius]|uniref:Prolyl endopeptidase-like n=1 Tax=Lithocarpus litseifolius TaxID=425828 RepID=A0AAW2CQC8_9ROSI